MSTEFQSDKQDTIADTSEEDRLEALIARYRSPEFTKELTQHFHDAKQLALSESDSADQLPLGASNGRS